jgi:hypothetical protein
MIRKPKAPEYTPKQITALKARALQLWKADDSSAKELGLALLAVRAALKHGVFKKWFLANNLSQARVSYCMRLAQNKVTAAKAKRARDPQRIAMSEAKKQVDSFLKFCFNPRQSKTVDDIEVSMGRLYLRIIGGVGRIKGWHTINARDPKVETATHNFKLALSALLDAAFNPKTFDDLERMHPDSEPASHYLPKKPPANVVA